jgi:hypothetical protein
VFWLILAYDAERVLAEASLPHPNIGTPGCGDLTLTTLGEAGVTGREEDMMFEVALRS